jgi:hypothetical protein
LQIISLCLIQIHLELDSGVKIDDMKPTYETRRWQSLMEISA